MLKRVSGAYVYVIMPRLLPVRRPLNPALPGAYYKSFLQDEVAEQPTGVGKFQKCHVVIVFLTLWDYEGDASIPEVTTPVRGGIYRYP